LAAGKPWSILSLSSCEGFCRAAGMPPSTASKDACRHVFELALRIDTAEAATRGPENGRCNTCRQPGVPPACPTWRDCSAGVPPAGAFSRTARFRERHWPRRNSKNTRAGRGFLGVSCGSDLRKATPWEHLREDHSGRSEDAQQTLCSLSPFQDLNTSAIVTVGDCLSRRGLGGIHPAAQLLASQQCTLCC